MDSRIEKNDENNGFKSRFQRNEELYKEISKNDLEGYDIKSNAEVIGDNKPEIDVEKIKKILDTKYNQPQKKKTLRMEEEEEEVVQEIFDDTKEYDINVILEKAKSEKEENYEEERLQKIHNTQFDILKKLDVDDKDDDDTDPELKTLINTISINESKKNDDDTDSSLDILSDLKGDDNTEKLDGLKDEITMKTNDIIDLDASIETEEIEVEEDKEEKDEKKEEGKTEIINSFYTASNKLKEKDFEDDDFAKDIEANSKVIKIIVAIIILVFLVGIGILIKTIFF